MVLYVTSSVAFLSSSTSCPSGRVSDKLASPSSKAATSGYFGEARSMDLDFDLARASSESDESGESGSGDFRRCYCDREFTEPDLSDLARDIGIGAGLLPVVKYKLVDWLAIEPLHVWKPSTEAERLGVVGVGFWYIDDLPQDLFNAAMFCLKTVGGASLLIVGSPCVASSSQLSSCIRFYNAAMPEMLQLLSLAEEG